jgi:hypothetical protein
MRCTFISIIIIITNLINVNVTVIVTVKYMLIVTAVIAAPSAIGVGFTSKS